MENKNVIKGKKDYHMGTYYRKDLKRFTTLSRISVGRYVSISIKAYFLAADDGTTLQMYRQIG